MFCGIDLGSRSVKIMLSSASTLPNDFSNASFRTEDTINFYRHFAAKENEKIVLNVSALGLPQDVKICACGYGRQAAALANAQVLSEIQAHAYGAMFQTKKDDFLLIDLGGQDSKIIRVKNGNIVDFSANDKCAAGSGRYLENMAQVLGISIDYLSNAQAEPVFLSSTCAVFGESELIGKIIEGHSTKTLAAGVNYSVIRRLMPMINRHLPAPNIFFSGGVAQNEAIIYLLEKELGQKVEKLYYSQHNGALGCCVYAMQNQSNEGD